MIIGNSKKKSADDFIRDHWHINYCEVIIYPDGDLEYAVPSHVEALVRIAGESRDSIDNKMPITSSPIKWLVSYTGCVAVWFNFYIVPEEYTEKQKTTIRKLIDSGAIDVNSVCKVSREKIFSLCTGNLSPNSGGCWFCHNAITNPVDKGFSMELDTNFHVSCLLKQIAEHPDNQEATIIAKEFEIL